MDSGVLRTWMHSCVDAVARHRDRLDDINVFPIPDADTGTNVYVTLTAGTRAVDGAPQEADEAAVAHSYSQGMLTGARGNSGVIVSQYLSTLVHTLVEQGGFAHATPGSLVAALEAASRAARAAVGQPVEGTVLTVADQTARAAREASGDRGSICVAAVLGAREALALTPEQLPVAGAAGVVDAGAAALVLTLEQLAAAMGAAHDIASLEEVPWTVTPISPAPGTASMQGGAYEVMCVTAEAEVIEPESPHSSVSLRDALVGVGDSVAVSGHGGLWQTHVHTDDPQEVLALVQGAGTTHAVVRALAVTDDSPGQEIEIVALTACPGLGSVMADAGAVTVVAFSAEAITPLDVQRLIEGASRPHVAVVAGTPGMQAVAHAAREECQGVQVSVLASTTEAEVISAVTAAALSEGEESSLTAMESAIEATDTTHSSIDALRDDLERMISVEAQVATVILGNAVASASAQRAVEDARSRFPDLDVHIIPGLQDVPPVIIGVENAHLDREL